MTTTTTDNKQTKEEFLLGRKNGEVTIIKSLPILLYAKINSTGEQRFINVIDKMSVPGRRPADGILSQALSNMHHTGIYLLFKMTRPRAL